MSQQSQSSAGNDLSTGKSNDSHSAWESVSRDQAEPYFREALGKQSAPYSNTATAPKEDAKAPEEDAKAPEEDAKAPEEDAKAPEEDAKVPREYLQPGGFFVSKNGTGTRWGVRYTNEKGSSSTWTCEGNTLNYFDSGVLVGEEGKSNLSLLYPKKD